MTGGSDPERSGKSEGPSSLSPSARAQELVGRVLANRYQIDSVIAMGSMGAVYRGQHVHMRNRVAMKVLHPETEGLPELVERFERESIVGAHAAHPNVATAADFGRLEDGSYYLVLEYIDGITLRELCRRGPVPVKRAVDIARQIALGLSAIHQLDIVHRDLKPRNVMVSREPPDVVKLIDFGFAKLPVERFVADPSKAAALTTRGVVFGTVGYMAPEVTFGMQAVGPAADLYALGVMLYEMLTGKPPYDETEPSALFARHQLDPAPPFAERAPDRKVPPALETVTMRLLEKNPADRYPSAAAVIDALDVALRELGPLPPPSAVGSSASPSSGPSVRSSESSAADARPAATPPPPRARRRTGIGWRGLLLGGLCVVAGLLYLRPGLRTTIVNLFGHEPPTASSPAPSRPSASPVVPAAPPRAPESSAPPAASTAAPAERPTAVDGIDAVGWRGRLRTAAAGSDSVQGVKALLALSEIDPAGLAERGVIADVAAIAALAEIRGDESADRVFELLASPELAGAGPDVLYHIVSVHGGSKGARRASEMLARADVMGRASPALRITMSLSDSACSAKGELLERAGEQGDQRTLALLQAMQPPGCQKGGGCCLRQDPRYASALQRLQQRTASQSPPATQRERRPVPEPDSPPVPEPESPPVPEPESPPVPLPEE